MNEQAIQDAFDTDDAEQEVEAEENEAVAEVEEEVSEPVPQLSNLEQEAVDMGWSSKDDFVTNGGDPDRHKSAHEYVTYGKLANRLTEEKSKTDQYQRDTDKRIEGLNKIHQQQMDAQIESLRDEQRIAVGEADTEKFDHIQKRIDGMEAEPPPVQGKDPAIVDWETKNPWINDPKNPKVFEANGLLAAYQVEHPNSTMNDALSYVDERLNVLHPPPANQRRNAPNTSERGRPQRQASGKLSMGDLTQDEKQLWSQAGFDLWGNDQKAFLQSVKDSRKG